MSNDADQESLDPVTKFMNFCFDNQIKPIFIYSRNPSQSSDLYNCILYINNKEISKSTCSSKTNLKFKICQKLILKLDSLIFAPISTKHSNNLNVSSQTNITQSFLDSRILTPET